MRTYIILAPFLALLAATSACSHSVTRPILPGIAFCSLLPDGEDVTFETAQGDVSIDLDDVKGHPCGEHALLVYVTGMRDFEDTYDTLAYADIRSFTSEAILQVNMRDGSTHTAKGNAWRIENRGGTLGDITMHIRIPVPKTDRVRVETRVISASEIRAIEIGRVQSRDGAIFGVFLGLLGLALFLRGFSAGIGG